MLDGPQPGRGQPQPGNEGAKRGNEGAWHWQCATWLRTAEYKHTTQNYTEPSAYKSPPASRHAAPLRFAFPRVQVSIAVADGIRAVIMALNGHRGAVAVQKAGCQARSGVMFVCVCLRLCMWLCLWLGVTRVGTWTRVQSCDQLVCVRGDACKRACPCVRQTCVCGCVGVSNVRVCVRARRRCGHWLSTPTTAAASASWAASRRWWILWVRPTHPTRVPHVPHASKSSRTLLASPHVFVCV